MDWLRSQDLKEERNVTTPVVIIAVYALGRLEKATGRTQVYSRLNASDRLGATT
jgi:hypothetical protein